MQKYCFHFLQSKDTVWNALIDETILQAMQLCPRSYVPDVTCQPHPLATDMSLLWFFCWDYLLWILFYAIVFRVMLEIVKEFSQFPINLLVTSLQNVPEPSCITHWNAAHFSTSLTRRRRVKGKTYQSLSYFHIRSVMCREPAPCPFLWSEVTVLSKSSSS